MNGGCDTCKHGWGEENCNGCLWDGKAQRNTHWEPFINKPCVSEGVCHEDKMKVLEKIRKEIEENRDEWLKGQDPEWHAYDRCIAIIDRHIAESEDAE